MWHLFLTPALNNRVHSFFNQKINLLQNSNSKNRLYISTEMLNDAIIDAIQDVKGMDIVKMDLRHIEDAPAEYFIVCHGESNTQVDGIAHNIVKKIQENLGVKAAYKEGVGKSSWVLIDYFSVVVHVFYRDKRGYYRIEDLWSDAKVTEYKNLR